MLTRQQWVQLVGFFGLLFVGGILGIIFGLSAGNLAMVVSGIVLIGIVIATSIKVVITHRNRQQGDV